MLSPAEKQLLAALKRALEARFGERLTELTLFGSRAKGVGRDDSDLDVFVGIRDVSRSERGEVLDLAADLGVDYGLVLSPLVLAVDDAGNVREDARRLHDDIVREGVAL